MLVGQGLDPQNNRNKCKLIWDSSSGSRAWARSQNVGSGVSLVKSQREPKIPGTQRGQTVRSNVTVQRNAERKSVEPSQCGEAQSRTRRRSISDVIANRMSMFEETKETRGVSKKKKSVHFQVKSNSCFGRFRSELGDILVNTQYSFIPQLFLFFSV